jgi:hypothetical protein
MDINIPIVIRDIEGSVNEALDGFASHSWSKMFRVLLDVKRPLLKARPPLCSDIARALACIIEDVFHRTIHIFIHIEGYMFDYVTKSGVRSIVRHARTFHIPKGDAVLLISDEDDTVAHFYDMPPQFHLAVSMNPTRGYRNRKWQVYFDQLFKHRDGFMAVPPPISDDVARKLIRLARQFHGRRLDIFIKMRHLENDQIEYRYICHNGTTHRLKTYGDCIVPVPQYEDGSSVIVITDDSVCPPSAATVDECVFRSLVYDDIDESKQSQCEQTAPLIVPVLEEPTQQTEK